LFFWAGAVYVALHKKYISQISGIAKKMPVSMAVFTIGALSLIGIPPLSGFISKYYFVSGAVEAGMLPVAVVFAVSSFLNALYFLPIIYTAYMKPLDAGMDDKVTEAPLAMLIPMCITAGAAVLLFFFPQVLTSFTDIIVSGLFYRVGGHYGCKT
ncbi:MAG: monovalent cation/H+ antiporter subunit D family protein, partial [Geovibrio sp.]|nr:monovalent cation/H+ antiporter subunit D family protein [Geovibrio sp.]